MMPKSVRNKAPIKKTAPAPSLQPIDTSVWKAIPVKVGHLERVHLCLVGVGGSGSWLAPAVARTALQLHEQGVETQVTLVDPDSIERSNIFRQNFSAAEIGRNKAESLAMRLSAAWGLEIHAQPVPFRSSMVSEVYGRFTVVIGCVDNAAARQTMAETVDQGGWWDTRREAEPARHWWLDLGNSRRSGQVLIGSTLRPERLKRAFPLPDRCGALPAPRLQHPELLIPKPEELNSAETGLSCEEMAARNAQSLIVNQMIAAIGADYLVQLVLSQSLIAYATYFDLATMSMRSKYVTPEALEVFATPRRKSRKKTEPHPR